MVAAVPSNFMRDVVRDNRAPTGPTGAIPRSQQQPTGGGPANVPGSGTGWGHSTPLGPTLRQFLHGLQLGFALDEFGAILRILRIELRIDVTQTGRSDDNIANKNYYKRIAAEYAELDDPRIKAQMQLDRWWESQRDLDWEDDDIYYVGGFQERWSQTPSYTKFKRDRDWRIK
jgi:hypothetical protein